MWMNGVLPRVNTVKAGLPARVVEETVMWVSGFLPRVDIVVWMGGLFPRVVEETQ